MVIISIIGRQGSGKTTIGRYVAEQLHCPHIEASDVVRNQDWVREKYYNINRDQMAKTNELTKTNPSWLADAIMKKINDFRTGFHRANPTRGIPNTYVLTGSREVEVHKYLRSKYNVDVRTFRLDADYVTRWNRHKGNKAKSLSQFAVHELNEQKIGLNKLFEYETKSPQFSTSYSTNAWNIASLIVECLDLREDTV